VSADFGDHSVGHLISGVLPRHNRTAFTIFCYSLSPSDGSQWWAAAASHCDTFVDVSARSANEIAIMIATDGTYLPLTPLLSISNQSSVFICHRTKNT
jgi:protein O-GlcNAc transferase